MSKLEYFKLPGSGDPIPAIGFGSGTKWRIQKWDLAAKNEGQEHFVDELATIIKDVIETGFLHIDTAEAYTTRKEVGEGIKAANVPRSKIFLTDKWSPGFRGSQLGPYESALNALKELDQEYVDLFLIHSPGVEKAGLTLPEAWKQVIQLQKEGYAKNIGVSNFGVEHLDQIIDAEVKPQVNQIEYHAYLQTQSPGVVEYAKKHDILIEAYGPLSPLVKGPGPLDNLLEELSQKYQRSKSLILLRWVYQGGVLPLTTSSKLERLQDALKVFEFSLDESDFLSISKLGREKIHRSFAVDLYGKYDDVLYK